MSRKTETTEGKANAVEGICAAFGKNRGGDGVNCKMSKPVGNPEGREVIIGCIYGVEGENKKLVWVLLVLVYMDTNGSRQPRQGTVWKMVQ